MQSRWFAAGVFVTSLAFAVATQPSFSQDSAPAPQQEQGAPQQQPEQGARPRRPLPKPTNLQVLPKDIQPEQLVHIMRGVAGALGVECNFCHVPGPKPREMNFASDEKPEKATARIMLRMTQAMNDQYMSQIHDPDAKPEDKQVTCGTCHRGRKMPEHFVPPPEHHNGPGGQPPQGGMPQGTPPQGPPPQGSGF